MELSSWVSVLVGFCVNAEDGCLVLEGVWLDSLLHFCGL